MKMYLFVFLLLISCNKHEASKNTPVNLDAQTLEDDFFPGYYSKDTLSLDVMIDDCGEWGGPEDRFRIYIDSLRQYKLDFRRYRFNCDSIGKYYGVEKPLELKKTFVLDSDAKKAVSDFLVDLMKEKIKQDYSDTANVYVLWDKDSTLLLNVRSDDDRLEQQYYKFKKNLGLPENRRKEENVSEIINN